MKKIFILIIIFLIPIINPIYSFNQNSQQKIKYTKLSNISDNFNDFIDIDILGVERTFSKEQGVSILKNFFKKYPIKSYEEKHTGISKNDIYYTIYTYETIDNNSFIIYYLFKNVKGKTIIYQLKIQQKI